MTCHGFGTGKVLSSAQKIASIASQISEVRGVIWTHRVEQSGSEGRDYNIIFEFGHWHKFGYNSFDGFLREIEKIDIHDVSIYTIKDSYKG